MQIDKNEFCPQDWTLAFYYIPSKSLEDQVMEKSHHFHM